MKVYSLELKEFYETYGIKDNDLQGVNLGGMGFRRGKIICGIFGVSKG